MSGNFKLVLIALGLAVLSGCGKGIDASLSTTREGYRASLDKAWKEMSSEQQSAYNWAVSDFTLEQLIAKYPSLTPRKVITQEADEYIQLKTRQIAETSAELVKNAARLAQEEEIVRGVEAELAKITVTEASIRNSSFGFRDREIIFLTKNDSKYDLSSATWRAWLFIDDEQESDRSCDLRVYYEIHGGLRKGMSLKYSQSINMNCTRFDTLEVRNAKRTKFKFVLDNSSVEDFAEKKVLPHFSPTRATYENAIKAAKDEIANALKYKATVQ